MNKFELDGVKVSVNNGSRELTVDNAMNGIALERWKARNKEELERLMNAPEPILEDEETNS